MSTDSSRSARGDAGFTLIELVVALFLAALVTGIIFQLIRGQASFVAHASARQEVVQNAQGALEIISSEIRGIPSRGVLDAGANHLSVAVPQAWGISCGGSTATDIWMTAPSSLPATAFSVAGGGARGLYVNDGAAGWLPTTLQPVANVTAIATFDPTVAGNACAALSAWGPANGVRLTGTNFPAAPAGSSVVVYGLARYDVGSVGGTAWVRRSQTMNGTADFQMQPLAGPLQTATALRFRYFNAAGVEIAAPGAAAPGAGISQIRITVSTVSSNPMVDPTSEVERDEVTISLRN